MRRQLLLLIIFATLLLFGSTRQSFAAEPQPTPADSGERRIVFLGDSITAAGLYVAYFDAWRIATGVQQETVIDAGLSSETVSGLSEEGHAGGKFPRPHLAERLTRVLDLTRPDMVIACYGMNCGIYQPFDEARFAKYQQGIRDLKEAVESRGATIIFMTPPFYDDQRRPLGFSYNKVLDQYSDWLLEQRTHGWQVIDLHGPMTRQAHARRAMDPDFAFQRDGVHPTPAGHWFIAQQLIKHFGGDVDNFATPESMLSVLGASAALLPAVQRRTNLLRDAYVGAAGHKRPGVAPGLPIAQAEAQANQIMSTVHD